MALSIKNETVDRLASELAEATGETVTEAIRVALEQRLRPESGRAAPGSLREQLAAIRRRRCSRLPSATLAPPTRSSVTTSTGCRADGPRHQPLLAIVFDEPGAETLKEAIEGDRVRLLSAGSVLKAALAVEARLGEAGGREFDLLLH